MATTNVNNLLLKIYFSTRTETDSQNGDHMEGYQWGGGGGRWGQRYYSLYL